MKYNINKEFFPFSKVAPPIRSPKLAGFLGSLMPVPRWIFHDKEIAVKREKIPGYNGDEIEIFIFSPKEITEPSPCLIYYHGGGFFFDGAGYHYKISKKYALSIPCKLIFVKYRLAPKHPFPTAPQDCFAAYKWAIRNAQTLGIDTTRIAVGGDSAGGNLAAVISQMARDREEILPVCQMLIYPVTDRRMTSESSRLMTDAPMWNSTLSKMMWRGYLQGYEGEDIAYASPAEAKDFSSLPTAYIETAEFDSLRDEGIAYAKSLADAGVEVTLNETKGTMHGYDIVEKSPTTISYVAKRIEFLQSKLYK